MTEAEMNSYRFGSGVDPTDEMLAQIMHEAAIDAKKRSEEATRAYFDRLEENSKNIPQDIKNLISQIRNV